MRTQSPTISVVIPCYNEESYVGALLGDIARQTYRAQEVIIADSRSTDNTVAIAEQYEKQLPLSVVTSQTRTPGAARNVGADIATGDYIAFIDADCRLPTNALEGLVEATKNGEVDFVSPIYATPGHHIVDQLAIKVINRDLVRGITAHHHVPGIGCLMFVRRNCHKTIDGFDAELSKGNDIDYLTRLKTQGVSSAVTTELVVETSNRRLKKDGRIISILNFTPERSWVGKRIVYPFLKRIGKEKKYGIF